MPVARLESWVQNLARVELLRNHADWSCANFFQKKSRAFASYK